MENEETQVNHPSHYCQGEHEVIELTEQLSFCLGNAVKYILRAPYKGQELRDLKKARWYLQRIADQGLDDVLEDDLIDLARSFGNPLLTTVFGALCEAADSVGGDRLAALAQAVDAVDRQIVVVEMREVKRELKRCKEELRKTRTPEGGNTHVTELTDFLKAMRDLYGKDRGESPYAKDTWPFHREWYCGS